MFVPARSEPLRVHILIDSLTWGGAEMLLGDLAAGAPAAGIELSVAYLRDADGNPAAARLRESGVEPQLVPVHRMLEAAAVPRLRAHLARVRPDVLHTHLSLADVLGTASARTLRLPALSTVHLVAGEATGLPSDLAPRGRARARLAAVVRRRAGSRVICVSEAARSAYLGQGWDTPERVVTVHNGIARSGRPGAGAPVRSQLGLAPDELIVTTVTVLRRGKGHDLVVEAVRRLLPRFPKLRLVVLGDGPAREEIRRLAAPLGETVLFTGHRDDVMALLDATDVLAHPTEMDAFPTALLEASAARVPILATAVGGIPEIVSDGETGLLLSAPASADSVTEALGRMLGDEQLRRRLADRAYERFLERFTAERWAGRLVGVYEEVLVEASRRRLRRGRRSRQPS
ncbi:MAG: glycosyl transferase group 1 [Solirubrobacterales bacterium]|nr:glycosyl transferase group 1 [Solirubrobacterales bacterium]